MLENASKEKSNQVDIVLTEDVMAKVAVDETINSSLDAVDP